MGGFLYQRLVVGAKGMEQFPHLAFWQDLGNLVAVSSNSFGLSLAFGMFPLWSLEKTSCHSLRPCDLSHSKTDILSFAFPYKGWLWLCVPLQTTQRACCLSWSWGWPAGGRVGRKGWSFATNVIALLMSSHLFSPQTKAYTARLLKPSLRISCLAIKILAFQWAFDLTLNGLPLLLFFLLCTSTVKWKVDIGCSGLTLVPPGRARTAKWAGSHKPFFVKKHFHKLRHWISLI